MGKRQTKIDKMGLAPVVLECISRGMTSYAIAAKISAEVVPIDQSTVSRWIVNNRGQAQSNAQRMFAEHIDKELPKDLDALEEMEALCLAWAREDISARSARITAWQRVMDALDDIVGQIEAAAYDPDPKKKRRTVQEFVSRVTTWVQDDYADQKRRLDAMAMGAKIIVGKLQHAGVLGSSEDFGIVIKPYDDSSPLGERTDEKPKNRLFAVKMAKEPTA